MKILYAEALRSLAEGRWKFSPCCFQLFYVRHDEGGPSLLLTCSDCGQRAYRIPIRSPLSPLKIERRAAFSMEDGKLILHLVAEVETEEFWLEFRTGERQLVRLLPRDCKGWRWWLLPVEKLRELAAVFVDRVSS